MLFRHEDFLNVVCCIFLFAGFYPVPGIPTNIFLNCDNCVIYRCISSFNWSEEDVKILRLLYLALLYDFVRGIILCQTVQLNFNCRCHKKQFVSEIFLTRLNKFRLFNYVIKQSTYKTSFFVVDWGSKTTQITNFFSKSLNSKFSCQILFKFCMLLMSLK